MNRLHGDLPHTWLQSQEHWDAKVTIFPYSEVLRREPPALSLPYLPAPACLFTLHSAGQKIHTVTCPGTEVPAFFGGQLLTMPRAVFVGLLASQMADLLWKAISSHLSKDYKYKQTEAKTVAVFENLQTYPPFLPVTAGVLLSTFL